MRYRIVLCGFSEFECRAMRFSFQHSEVQPTGYDVTSLLIDADFAVVDAESKVATDNIVSMGRSGSAVFIGTNAPAGAAAHLRRPIDPTRILKALRQLEVRRPAPRLDDVGDDEVTKPIAGVNAHPAVAGTVQSAPEPAVPNLIADALADAGPHIEPIGEKNADASRSNAKAAKRGAVRRARLSRADEGLSAAIAGPQKVFVLDADPSTSASLCDLLVRFGFQVVAVRDIEAAHEAAAGGFFVAYFLDIALNSADDLDLLESIRAQTQHEKLAEPEVFMIVSQLQPADRVRAALAGVGTPLLKPVTRGDLARALEGRGVSLPADARRG